MMPQGSGALRAPIEQGREAMDVMHPEGATEAAPKSAKKPAKPLPGQIVLAFQGGGALNAYQGGVYEALHEAGIEPDWVIGISSGAINAGLIAGNPPEKRLERLREFWSTLEYKPWWEDSPLLAPWFATSRLFSEMANKAAHVSAFFGGVPGYYAPNRALALGVNAPLGAERASLYTTEALAKTMTALTDPAWFNSGRPRLTVSTVNIKTGRLQYFDSARMPLELRHVLASAALPISFGAVRIDGDPYWDGGIYSNTPIEVVFEDNPRRDSIVFADQMWHSAGAEPQTFLDVLSREKDIQFASRDASHIVHQQNLHRLRHVVRELVRLVPEDKRDTPEVKALAAYGCKTFMHIVRLNAPYIEGEGNTRDFDFTREGIRLRWQAGHDDTARVLAQRPWEAGVDPMVGVAVHDCKPDVLAFRAPERAT
jgi:NTE family protein